LLNFVEPIFFKIERSEDVRREKKKNSMFMWVSKDCIYQILRVHLSDPALTKSKYG
jgi:hypothetical protein